MLPNPEDKRKLRYLRVPKRKKGRKKAPRCREREFSNVLKKL